MPKNVIFSLKKL